MSSDSHMLCTTFPEGLLVYSIPPAQLKIKGHQIKHLRRVKPVRSAKHTVAVRKHTVAVRKPVKSAKHTVASAQTHGRGEEACEICQTHGRERANTRSWWGNLWKLPNTRSRARKHTVAVRKRSWAQGGLSSDQSCPLPTHRLEPNDCSRFVIPTW